MQPRRSDVAFADIFGRPAAPQNRSTGHNNAQPPHPPIALTPPYLPGGGGGYGQPRTGQRTVSAGNYSQSQQQGIGLGMGGPHGPGQGGARASYYANNEAIYSSYHQPYPTNDNYNPPGSTLANNNPSRRPGAQSQSPELNGQQWQPQQQQQQQHQHQQDRLSYPPMNSYTPAAPPPAPQYQRSSYAPSVASGPSTASTSTANYSHSTLSSAPSFPTTYSQAHSIRSTSPANSLPPARYSGPPRLPEFSPAVDDFYGFESSRTPDMTGGGRRGSGMEGTPGNSSPNHFVHLETEEELGQGREEDDGFDQFGPTSNYQYYEPSVYTPSTSGPISVDQSRRNSAESDLANSLYLPPQEQRPLLALNPSLASLPSYNPTPQRSLSQSQAQSLSQTARRRSSESVHVLPTQPKANPNPQGDRAFSFSGGSERPDLLGGRAGPPAASSASNALVTRRAPVVYPALLSRVAEAFKTRVVISERVKDGLVYSDAFDGRDAVDKISYIIKTTDRNLALLLGRALDAQKFFHDVTYDHRLRDSQIELYQFRERLGGGNFLNSSDDLVGSMGAVVLGGTGTGGTTTPGAAGGEEEFPSGVFTLLTDCYSPTCTRDRLCYSIACPRRLEQQARLNLKPKPGLQRSVSSESLGDMREPGSLWIYSVPQDIADSTSESEKKRQEALNEVFYTERDFVRDMEYLRDSWIKPLRTRNIIPESRREDFITQVFWNVLEILAVNVRLAEMLNKRQKQAHVVEKVGDIFLEMVPHFAPFVKYGAHQLYGKYEFEKEKASNPAFAEFVNETERLPESRKLELNGYLTKPTTRLARYPLLLEACLKNTPEDNPDKVMLPKVVKLVREFLNSVNIETGKSENRFNLAQLDQQLVFKNGEAVDLRLRDEEREMIFKGPLKKKGGSQSESAELQVFLFDHALLMVKQKGKNEQYKVYRKPIPLELLVVAPLDDTPSARAGTARPRSLVSRGSNARYLANPPPGIDKNSKQGFAMTFIHLGRRGYQITLWSASWAGRKKWLEKIEARQEELRERSLVFDTIQLSSGFFAGTNRVTCAAPFENGNRIVYGTDNGVYLSDLRQKSKAPVKVISVPNVTQLDVLDDQGILIVLADKAVQTFFVDNLDPGDAVGAAKRARKISSHATFFKAGQCLGRTLVCVVKSGSVSSTIKTLEPIDSIRGKKQPAIRKFLQGSNESLRVFKEFYIPTESSSVHFLKTKLCVGCTKGFEIVDLETLDTQGLLDPADSSLDFVQKRENARPVAIYRIEGEFLLCYDEFAFYVNKNGWRAKSNWIIQWEGVPTSFALHYPYVLAFEPTFIEVHHVDSGALMQIIPGNNFRCLYADTPTSSSLASYIPPPPPNQYGYAPSGHHGSRAPSNLSSLTRPEIILADYDRISRLVLAQ